MAPRGHRGNGFGVCNDNGTQILDCVEAEDLAIIKIFFKKQETHLATYTSGRQSTQFDYWLTQQRHLKLITNDKVIASDATAPQHRLLVMDMRLVFHPHLPSRTIGPEKT